MTISLLRTADDPRKISKSFTTIAADLPCKPAEPFSILQPRIIINYTAAYAACNYVYIPEFSRYYFAELTLLSGRELQLNCKIDVLSSFDLSDVEIMCVRSESAGVNLAPDSKLPVDPDRSFVEGKLMPLQPLSNQTAIETPLSYQYLLITNGGALLGD